MDQVSYYILHLAGSLLMGIPALRHETPFRIVMMDSRPSAGDQVHSFRYQIGVDTVSCDYRNHIVG